MATLDVQPSPLIAGGNADVSISGGPANQTVTVNISDGGSPPQTDSVDVQLDGNGNGTSQWDVPESGWSTAVFTYDTEQVTRAIDEPKPG